MPNLQKWENIIKEKRKKTDFRDYLKEIASWLPLVYYKNKWFVSRYLETSRTWNLVKFKDYWEYREIFIFWNNFLNDFGQLYLSSDFSSIFHYNKNKNSDYSDIVYYSSDNYLSNTVIKDSSHTMYSFSVKENSHNVINSMLVWNNSENIYFGSCVISSYNIFSSRYVLNSSDIWFSTNLVWCKECLLCNDIENSSYMIKNVKYEKDEYYRQKKDILNQKKYFLEIYKNLDEFWKNLWENILNSSFVYNWSNIENWYNSFWTNNARNVAFWWWALENKDIYDCMNWWSQWNADLYWVCNAWAWCSNIYLSNLIASSSNIYYSIDLWDCSFCLGCIWLRNKSFCILNKQYTKEEWYEMADKIFAQMDKDWTLWEFFPWSLNPFYFNDTMAYLIDDSFTKQEVEKQGYMWRDEEIKVDIPENVEIIHELSLQDYQGFDENWTWQINSEIMKKVIKDKKGNYYRIVKMEYDFLLKHWLPLPEIHWLDRIKLGFRFR